MLVIPYDIFVKLFIFFSSSFLYSLVQQNAYIHNFEAYIFGCVSIRTVKLLWQVLWLLKFSDTKSWYSCSTCEIHQTSIFSKFESFACASHRTIFDIYISRSLLSSDLSLVWKVVNYVAYNSLVTYASCLGNLISGF